MSISPKCLFVVAIAFVSTLFGQTIQTANVTFTTIDVPGAGITSVQGINSAGDVVGIYGATGQPPYRAFLLSGGIFTLLDYPGASDTRATGINDSGLIVGTAITGSELGFVYDGTSFTPINVPGKSATVALGVDNAGDIVGGDGSTTVTRAFELTGGHFKNVSPRGSYVYGYATSINNFSTVVGWTDSGGDAKGFVYKNGQFKKLAVPGAIETEAEGINDNGVIVGWYQVGPTTLGFALMNGKYLSINYPGASDTLAEGINASGQIVGLYSIDGFTYHGFVTSPISYQVFEQ